MKLIALAFVLPLAGAFFTFAAFATEDSGLTPAQKTAALVLERAQRVDARDGNRWAVAGSTIRFEGELTKGECARFRAAVGAARELVVNSGGGDAAEGLCIGEAMRELGFERTIVDGLCVSSCANYLFLGSPRRVIRHGIVGYHGNITALLHQVPMESAMRSQLKNSGLSADEQEQLIQSTLANYRAQSDREQKFLASLGVSQELFERTQRVDKGVPGGEYEFLLPKPVTFSRYGVTGIEGEQDVQLGEDMGLPNLFD